jgi:hypothetical protein
LFNLIKIKSKKSTKETELSLWLSGPSPCTPVYGESRTRAASRISSAGAHSCEGGTVPRTMAANPVIKLGGNRAHTQTTVLDQLKKSQQNRATAFGSCQITANFF